jgi:hypothetical protein
VKETSDMTTKSNNAERAKRLVNLEATRAKHGCKVDFMAEMLQVGDPLADAVIAEINELGKDASGQLNKGLITGHASLDNPSPAIAAFLTELETVPEWVDRDALEKGDVSELSVPPMWKVLAAGGTIELTHVYASPSIAKLLVQTAHLRRWRHGGWPRPGYGSSTSCCPAACCAAPRGTWARPRSGCCTPGCALRR